MNIYKSLNQLTKYIEDNLENKIDYTKLAKILLTNPYVMQRFFYLITNITITDYIKKRRLSKAATDIIKGQKIIDVAIKYQYNSSEAFSRAFKAMHKVNPSIIKKEKIKLNLTTMLVFDENINNISNINYHIVKNKSFKIYTHSFTRENDSISDYTEHFWQETKNTNPALLVAEKRYGIVEYDKEKTVYHIGLEKNTINGQELIIPQSNWIVIKFDSFKAKDIDKKANALYDEYAQSLGYDVKHTFDIEIYYKDYVELWFPIL